MDVPLDGLFETSSPIVIGYLILVLIVAAPAWFEGGGPFERGSPFATHH